MGTNYLSENKYANGICLMATLADSVAAMQTCMHHSDIAHGWWIY